MKVYNILIILITCIWSLLSIFSDSGSKMYLHELLAGSEVYVEPLKSPEKAGANLSTYQTKKYVNK